MKAFIQEDEGKKILTIQFLGLVTIFEMALHSVFSFRKYSGSGKPLS